MNDSSVWRQEGAGLCGHCVHAQVIRNDRGSRFHLCRLAASNTSFPKYPVLPVLECTGFEGRRKEPDTGG